MSLVYIIYPTAQRGQGIGHDHMTGGATSSLWGTVPDANTLMNLLNQHWTCLICIAL